ncbi:MAG: hypothetical protein U0636_07355 [Phycisphaerales bacterium]
MTIMRTAAALPLSLLALGLAVALAASPTQNAPAQADALTPEKRLALLRDDMLWRAGSARDFAGLVQTYINREFVDAAARTHLNAMALVVAAHAQVMAAEINAFKADDSEASRRAMELLRARSDALRDERIALEREWNVWQVEHGLKKAEDVELLFKAPVGENGC